MFDAGYRPFSDSNTLEENRINYHVVYQRSALALYNRMHSRAGWAWLWCRLARRPFALLELERLGGESQVTGRHYAGLQAVSIRQIIGSENRADSFNRFFHPLKNATKDRWLNIAVARFQGVGLPPVALIQVGSSYFVRDGHHRISVSRALGQESVDAEVTVWKLGE